MEEIMFGGEPSGITGGVAGNALLIWGLITCLPMAHLIAAGVAGLVFRRPDIWTSIRPYRTACALLSTSGWGALILYSANAPAIGWIWTAGTWWAWWVTRDRDRWNHLLERGTGVVREIAGRLRVVPAPGGAS